MRLHFKINLTNSQKEALQLVDDDLLKYITIVFSRQSGKSFLMKILCIKWLFERNKDVGYVCRNYILAKKLYGDVIKYIPKEYIKSANGSDLSIKSSFGSTLQFFSAESGSSLRGLTFNYLICDEFAFFKFEQTDGTNLWNDILFPTIKVKGKKVLFVSTPLGKNNILYEMYIRGLDENFPNYATLHKTIYDDGLITNDEIDEIKAQIPELSFRQEFLCEFLDSAITFFVGFEKCFKKFTYDNNQKQFIGIDLSANGKDETILTKINQINQVKQYVIKGSLDEKYQQISKIINETNNLEVVYIENNGVGTPMINEVIKLVKNKNIIVEWNTTNQSKNDILSSLAMDIANGDIFFDEDDKQLYSQFSTIITKYSKTGKLQIEASSGHKDDRIMSLGIANRAKKDKTKTGNYTFAILTRK